MWRNNQVELHEAISVTLISLLFHAGMLNFLLVGWTKKKKCDFSIYRQATKVMIPSAHSQTSDCRAPHQVHLSIPTQEGHIYYYCSE